MAQGSYRRNLSTSYGKRQPIYAQALIGQTWVTQGSARTAEQRDALVARVRARHPEAALRIVEFGRNGERIERAVEQAAQAA